MVGADADRLDAAAATMRRAADELDEHSGALGRLLGGLSWLGQLAGAFLNMWNSNHKPQLHSTASFIRDAAAKLEAQAKQQRSASEMGGERQRGWPRAVQPERFGEIEPRVWSTFGPSDSGRGTVLDAFGATGDPSRAAFDEIEIRKLDNGRYIVVLPGVVDLTEKLDDVGRSALQGNAADPWYDGEQPDTVKRMAYAISESKDTSDSFVNPYSLRVIEQMQRAGVPQGADVMLVGHSFGAYTAMELAGNDKFNSADGMSEGYHVNVTHVVAAGADTNWKLPEIPPETGALILNNRFDAAFRAEDGLVSDVSPFRSNQVQIEFNGEFEGVYKAGHHPSTYEHWLAKAHDRPELNSWLDGAGAKYSAGGTSFSVKVPDYK
jgi:hypothetical protein